MIPAALLAAALATLVAALHPAQVDLKSTHFTTTDGVRLHVIEAGESRPGEPAIAFVPGWSTPASIWRRQLEALGANHRVVALDPRGQGESDSPAEGFNTERRAEDIHEFVSRHAPVVLVTWSLGSLEALQYLHGHGDAALSSELRRAAFPSSRLKGDANVLIMPNLDAANIAFNLLMVAAGGRITIGPILLGAARPVHIVTPSATVRRIVNMTALTVMDINAARRDLFDGS